MTNLSSETPQVDARRRMVCRIIGHRYNPFAAMYYSRYDCDRCGTENGDEPSIFRYRWWRLSEWVREVRRDIRHWWRCPYCNARLGAPHSDDCLPF